MPNTFQNIQAKKNFLPPKHWFKNQNNRYAHWRRTLTSDY